MIQKTLKPTWWGRGAYYSEGDMDKAIGDFTEAIDSSRTSPKPTAFGAGSLQEGNDLDQMIADYAE